MDVMRHWASLHLWVKFRELLQVDVLVQFSQFTDENTNALTGGGIRGLWIRTPTSLPQALSRTPAS